MYERVIVPWLDGDLAAVETGARQRVEDERAAGTSIFYANSLAMWALALCQLGESGRALQLVEEARTLADPDDVADQIDLDLAEGYAWALEGKAELARTFVEHARGRAQGTDMWNPVFGPEFVEACVLRLLGDVEGARRLLAGLVERDTRRGFHRFAARYRSELAALE